MGGVKAMRQKILAKLEKEHSNLESSISFLKARRVFVIILFFVIHLAAFMIGGEAPYVFFLIFGFPLLVIYGLQGIKLSNKNRRLDDLEKTILRNKD